MNESFEELNLSPSMVEDFISKVSLIQTNLTGTETRLSSCWKGASFNNFSSAVSEEQEKLGSLQELLVRMMKLIELVNEHIQKRRERISLEREIAALYGELTYEEWNEEEQRMETYEREWVRNSINRKEQEVNVLNHRLDQIVLEIDTITLV